jgi:PAS domain-containing protein
MNLSLVLAALVSVGGASFALTGSLRTSVILGVVAALGAWFALTVVQAQWRRAIRPVLQGVSDPNDVADFLRAEQTRRLESERRLALLRLAIDSLPTGVLVTSPSGLVVEHNRALPELIDAPSSSVIGWTAHELSREPELLDAVSRAGRSAEPMSVSLQLGSLRVLVSSLTGASGSLAVFVPAPH